MFATKFDDLQTANSSQIEASLNIECQDQTRINYTQSC